MVYEFYYGMMKKLLLSATMSLLLVSCSYMREINFSDTRLNFKILEVKGNYALIMTEPDNDYTLYLADIMEADDFEKAMSSMTEMEFQEWCIAATKEHYTQWRMEWPGRTDKYVADEFEHEYFISSNQGYFPGLKPLTRYYVYGFCVNPDKSEPLGPIQKLQFSTTEYNPPTDGIDFDFMIRDTDNSFYYYVRPSINGKISFDTYFSTVFKDTDYNAAPYCGDIRAYLKDWLAVMGNEVENFLSVDISRFQTILDLEEGEDYTIIGCPYVNLGNGPLTLLHFKYSEGMRTSYGHDSIINK